MVQMARIHFNPNSSEMNRNTARYTRARKFSHRSQAQS
uniref:Uncharacterized protein n=1 Tax=Candidatus Kentrum sp. FW TaxID=2126338 RepID=A0A450U0V7_9GAMM|nr:MAG: hypothetical protein BECKFW1821C_GA0114237_10948 [Candidatus Kentron sp. FW]